MRITMLLTGLALVLGGCQELVDPRVLVEAELIGAIVLQKATPDCVQGETYTWEECCFVWEPYMVGSQGELEELLEPWEPKGKVPDLGGFDEYTILVLHRPWCINQDKNEITTFYLDDDVLLVDVEVVPVGIEIEVNSGVAGIYGIPPKHVFDSVEVEFR